MKKILFVPFVLVIVLLVDLSYRYIGDYAYKIEPEAKNYGFAYQNFTKEAELVIIGSSRAKHHYDCKVFEDSLHLNTYNLGCDAYGILQQYLVLQRLIENNKGTSTVIFDVTHKTLLDAFGWSDNNELNFIPYYWRNDTLKRYMDERYGKYCNLKYLSSLIQYNGKVVDIIVNIRHKDKVYEWKNKGFDPIKYSGKPNTDFRSDNIKEYTPSPLCIQLLDNMVSLSRKHNIRLILMISPVVDDWTPFCQCLQNYASQNNVEFYDFSREKGLSDNMFFFKDYHHLNEVGAREFTKEVVGLLSDFK